jgi:hypothetical protein
MNVFLNSLQIYSEYIYPANIFIKIFIFFLLVYIKNIFVHLQLIISWCIYTHRNPHTEQPVSYIKQYKII